MSDELLEELAALEHKQWASWTKYMLEVLDTLIPEGQQLDVLKAVQQVFLTSMPESDRSEMQEVVVKQIRAIESLSHWHHKTNVPYTELSGEEKDSYREWAAKVLAVVEADR